MLLAEEFEIGFEVTLSWEDDRIQWIDPWNPEEAAKCNNWCVGTRQKCCDNLWLPKYTFSNGRVTAEIPLTDRPDGTHVTWDQANLTARIEQQTRVQAIFSSPMAFDRFPRDEQKLFASLRMLPNAETDPAQVTFEVDF